MHEKIFNNMHTSLIHGRNPGKFSEMAQATTFNIQLKTKEDIGGGREASYGRLPGKAQ